MDNQTPSSPVLPPSQSHQPAPAEAPRSGWRPLTLVLSLSAAFFVFFLIVSGVLFFYKGRGTSPAGGGGTLFGTGTVAVLELNGVIMDSKRTLRKLERLEESPEVKAIVLRLNSPGGSVAPSQEIYDAVKRSKKPIVASMGSVAASGAFYIACGAKKVFANPGTITGSIGVIMEFVNLEKLYEWAKVQRYVIKTGKFKDAGAEFRQMTPEERALLQGMVDDVLVQFKQAVVEGRKLPMNEVTAIADGRIMSGSQAKEFKLVDELGGIDEAIKEAGKMAGIQGKPKVHYPERTKNKWMDLIFEDSRDDSEASASDETLAAGIVSQLARLITGQGSIAGVKNPGFAPGVYWLWTGTH